MLTATLIIDGKIAESVIPSMSPEAGRELPRTETVLSRNGDTTVIGIKAADTSAMRAALNSHLECIKIIEDIDNLAEMKP